MGLLSLFDFRSRRRAGKLYDEARELVDDGAYEDALAIARKLRKLRYSGAYEIEGLAYSRLGRNEDAVRVLREGLAHAPAVWPNWLLLGSCLSNLGRYDEALLAYDRAQACEDADRDAVALNRAIVCSRAGDHAAALRHLDSITGYEDGLMRFRAVGTRVDALHKLGRVAEAEDLGLHPAGVARPEGDRGHVGHRRDGPHPRRDRPGTRRRSEGASRDGHRVVAANGARAAALADP